MDQQTIYTIIIIGFIILVGAAIYVAVFGKKKETSLPVESESDDEPEYELGDFGEDKEETMFPYTPFSSTEAELDTIDEDGALEENEPSEELKEDESLEAMDEESEEVEPINIMADETEEVEHVVEEESDDKESRRRIEPPAQEEQTDYPEPESESGDGDSADDTDSGD